MSEDLKLRADNKSGVVGVSWNIRRKRWVAQILVAGKVIHLGRFFEKEDAITAREAGEIEYGN